MSQVPPPQNGPLLVSSSANQSLVSAAMLLATTLSQREEVHLRRIAELLSQGLTIDQALSHDAKKVRVVSLTSVAALKLAASSAEPVIAMSRWIENRARGKRVWQRFRSAVGYSVWVSLGTIVPLLLLQWGWGVFIYSPLLTMIREFGLNNIPVHFEGLEWWMLRGSPASLALYIAALVAVGLFRILSGPLAWSRFSRAIPVLGPMQQWTSAAWWMKDLSLLLESEQTLPAAIAGTSQLGHDPVLIELSEELGREIAAGQTLAASIGRFSEIPGSVIPLVSLGERQNSLPAQLMCGAEILEARLEAWAEFLSGTLPTILLMLVGLVAFGLLYQSIAMGQVMMMVIQGLT